MAIKIPSGFQLTSTDPIDLRFIMTKAEMVAVNDGRMPDLYFTLCKDDGQFYIYRKSNDPSIAFGKFKLIDEVAAAEAAAQIKRASGSPADETSAWDKLEEAQAYALAGELAYDGQIVYVKENDSFYKISTNESGTRILGQLPDEKFIEEINSKLLDAVNRIVAMEDKLLAEADVATETLSLSTKLSAALS